MKTLLLGLALLLASCAPYESDMYSGAPMLSWFGGAAPAPPRTDGCPYDSTTCYRMAVAHSQAEAQRLEEEQKRENERLIRLHGVQPPPQIPPGFDARRALVNSCLQELSQESRGSHRFPGSPSRCTMIYNHPDTFLR